MPWIERSKSFPPCSQNHGRCSPIGYRHLDVPPAGARGWPPIAGVCVCFPVGKKCFVRSFHDEGVEWIEAGAHAPHEYSDEAGEGLPQGTAIKLSQARIYYCKASKDVRVLLPNDMPFRACRKGMTARSKSFDEEGNPVPGVQLLYALKIGLEEARFRAVESWPESEFRGEIFGEGWGGISRLCTTPHLFTEWAGKQIAGSAKHNGGLANWALWEKVADEAAAHTERLINIARGVLPPDNHTLFIEAVISATVSCEGIPYQRRAEKIWEDLGGNGEWRAIRDTLGFSWLPSLADWRKFKTELGS
jgi:hypothetical protein